MITFQKLKNAFKEKQVVLSGHTGFKGDCMLKTFSFSGADNKG